MYVRDLCPDGARRTVQAVPSCTKFSYVSETSLPPDWEEQVVRAYIVFAVDPLDGATELAFFGGRLDPNFLKEKAEKQLRDPKGKFRDMRARLNLPGIGGGKKKADAPTVKQPASKTEGKTRGKPIPDPPKAYDGWPRDTDGRVIMDWENVMKWMDGDSHKGKHSLLEHIEDGVDENGSPVKVLSKEREAVHQELVRKTLEGVPPVPLGQRMRALFLGGGPGAGKTTATKQLDDFPDARPVTEYDKRPPGDAVNIAADDYKMTLPEWDAWDPSVAGGYAHNESLLIADAARDAATKGRLNMIVDGTGDGGTSIVKEKIDSAQKSGYDAEGVYVTVPTSEATVRALTRGIETGRNLALHHLVLTHKGVSRDVTALLSGREGKGYDKFDLFDSDVPIDGDPLPIIKKGEIVDQAKYDAFVAKMEQSHLSQMEEALERASDPKRTYRAAQGLTPEQVRDKVIVMLKKEIDLAKKAEQN